MSALDELEALARNPQMRLNFYGLDVVDADPVLALVEQAKAEVGRLTDEASFHRGVRTRVEYVLDEALGTEEDDGTGEGLAADVWLLAAQRDEAQAAIRRARELIADADRRLSPFVYKTELSTALDTPDAPARPDTGEGGGEGG